MTAIQRTDERRCQYAQDIAVHDGVIDHFWLQLTNNISNCFNFLYKLRFY